jgi:hypothetical protein
MNYADDDNSPAARRARLLEFAGERLAPLYPSWTMIMVGGLATDDAEDAASSIPPCSQLWQPPGRRFATNGAPTGTARRYRRCAP